MGRSHESIDHPGGRSLAIDATPRTSHDVVHTLCTRTHNTYRADDHEGAGPFQEQAQGRVRQPLGVAQAPPEQLPQPRHPVRAGVDRVGVQGGQPASGVRWSMRSRSTALHTSSPSRLGDGRPPRTSDSIESAGWAPSQSIQGARRMDRGCVGVFRVTVHQSIDWLAVGCGARASVRPELLAVLD